MPTQRQSGSSKEKESAQSTFGRARDCFERSSEDVILPKKATKRRSSVNDAVDAIEHKLKAAPRSSWSSGVEAKEFDLSMEGKHRPSCRIDEAIRYFSSEENKNQLDGYPTQGQRLSKERSDSFASSSKIASPPILEKRASYCEPKQTDLFEKFSISQLKKLAREHQIDISTCTDRRCLVDALAAAGIHPTQRIERDSGSKPSQDIPRPTLEKRSTYCEPKQTDLFEEFSISQLKRMAWERHIDISTCSDRKDLVDTLIADGVRPRGHEKPPKDPFSLFSVSELKMLAASNRVDISSFVDKFQIITALKEAGVRPPRRGTPRSTRASNSGSPQVADYSISQLKRIALDAGVNISSCVEKREIVLALDKAGALQSSAPVSPLSRYELSQWRPNQLRLLASHLCTGSLEIDSEKLLGMTLRVVNVKKKHLRACVRLIAPLGHAPLGELLQFARENKVNVAGCVEKDEILERVLQMMMARSNDNSMEFQMAKSPRRHHGRKLGKKHFSGAGLHTNSMWS